MTNRATNANKAAAGRGRVSGRRPSQGQRTTSRNSETRVAARKAKSASHAKAQASRPRTQSTLRQAPAVGAGSRSARKSSARASTRPSAPLRGQGTSAATSAVSRVKDALVTNKAVLAAVIAIALVALFAAVDTFSNMGKVYGNVSINGMSVGGMTEQDMRVALDETFGNKLASAQVTVYASEEAREKSGKQTTAQEEDAATAEQISSDEAKAKATSWTTDGAALDATLPYDSVIEQAMSAGRAGGPFDRLAVAVAGQDIPLSVDFGETALDAFASDIDAALGDARIDATVEVSEGTAKAVPGHDGVMVDRSWLAGRMSDVLLERDGATYVIAEVSEAPSRTTFEQAETVSDAVNRAIRTGASFTYKQSSWSADVTELGDWTRVDVVARDAGYDLVPSIDVNTATAALVKHVSAATTTTASDSIVVDFEKSDGQVNVHTSGAGEIPEVVPAVETVNEALYGQTGAAWAHSAQTTPVNVEIGESNAPETLGFDQAVDLGLITVIGEYTTEFSNEEGTENRNHNIKLVSDILNDTVCESGGGKWSFNEHSGDTNLDPPFASAGSIVNGEYVDSIGGGICQVATTIFNAVYEAGLDVVERRNHSLYIASYPEGRDVGVSYPELDFVWENKLTSDVLLRLSYTDTTITAKLYSVYVGYKVETEVGQWEEGAKYSTEYETDDTLAKGDSYLKTIGEDGSRISIVRKVTDKAGNVVSETEFSSEYEPKNEVYLVGPGTDTSGLGTERESTTGDGGPDDVDDTEGGEELYEGAEADEERDLSDDEALGEDGYSDYEEV